MEAHLPRFWRAAKLPVLGLGVLFVLYLVWLLLDLPPQEQMIEIIKGYLATYGYATVLLGSFLEALLLIGWYFPGSLVIFLSVILSPTAASAALAVVCVTIGLYAGYTVNFFLGKYGWHRLLIKFGIREHLEEAQQKLARYGVRAIFSSYWNPGLASFTATAAGVLQYKVRTFLISSLVAVTLWNIFWGVLVYRLGERALDTLLSWPFAIFTVVVWIAARYIDDHVSSKHSKS